MINNTSKRCTFLLCMQSCAIWCIFWSPISNNLFHYIYHKKRQKNFPQSHRKSSQHLFIYCFALEEINGKVCHVDFGGGVIKRARIILLDMRRHKKQMGYLKYSHHIHLPVKVRGLYDRKFVFALDFRSAGIFSHCIGPTWDLNLLKMLEAWK